MRPFQAQTCPEVLLHLIKTVGVLLKHDDLPMTRLEGSKCCKERQSSTATQHCFAFTIM